MYNSALEQFEILPFLSFALPKIDHTSLFTQSFDLPNILIFLVIIFGPFILGMAIIDFLHDFVHAIDIDNLSRIPEDKQACIRRLLLRFGDLIKKYEAGTLTQDEIREILNILEALLRFNKYFNFLWPADIAALNLARQTMVNMLYKKKIRPLLLGYTKR